jgi:cyanophycinase-like exopeptidase
MQHTQLPVLQNPSKKDRIPASVRSGIVMGATSRQYAMMEGLLMGGSKGGEKASQAPIVAEGQYVGAPVMPKNASKKSVAPPTPETKSPLGMLYPVGQS